MASDEVEAEVDALDFLLPLPLDLGSEVEELIDDLPLVCLSLPLLEEDLFEVALFEDVDALALEVKALLLEDDLEELPPPVDSLLLEVSLTLLPPTALGPPCLTAASVALATIFSAVSCSLKGLLPLTFEAAFAVEVPLAVVAELADEPLPAAVLPLHAALLLLPSRWSLLGTISNLPSGCREPPCLVRLIFILRPFSLSLADEFCEEAAEPLPRPLRSLEVRVVVSVNVCVAEPVLLLLQFVVTSVLSLEEPEEAMPTGVPPPDEARLPPGDVGALPFIEDIDVAVEAVEDVVAGCPEAELADEVEVVAAGEAVDILSMSASKSMMRLPTSTSGQLLSSSKSKLSAAAEDDDDDDEDDEFEDCVELALVWFAFLLAFLTDEEAGLLRLPDGVPGLEAAAAAGPLLLPVGVTLTGGCTSSCIGRDVRPQHHGAQRYTVEAGAHMKALVTCLSLVTKLLSGFFVN